MKKIIKILVLSFLMLCVTASIFEIYAEATDYSTTILDDLKNVNDGEGNAVNAKKSVQNVVQIVVVIAKIIGIAVAITMLLVIGMKYMIAAPGEKADIKKSAVVYVVGALILFSVVGILGIISKFSTVITASTTKATE